MLGESFQLRNYVNVIKQLLNKAITDILLGILRTSYLLGWVGWDGSLSS